MTTKCPIQGFDHLEFYVGNAKQASLFYANYFGFNRVAYCGLETGERKKTSYLLEQGEIRFLISSALSSDHPIAHSVLEHGDTISIVALAVADVATAYHYAISRGAIGAIPPTSQRDHHGIFRFAAIRSFGDTLIKFVDRQDYGNNFAPGYISQAGESSNFAGLTHIDHVVGNVERGAMNYWVQFLIKTLGFDLRMYFDAQTISTEYSAMMSKVLENGEKTIININEPADGVRKSQIQEYLDFHHGAGIQHIGLATDNILQTVTQLQAAGVEFLSIPTTYYENLGSWAQELQLPIVDLAEQGILVDRDEDGYLLQIFTKPIGDRPTLFFEIIERRGSRGFGAGNFKSLFVAMEQEQRCRGNL